MFPMIKERISRLLRCCTNNATEKSPLHSRTLVERIQLLLLGIFQKLPGVNSQHRVPGRVRAFPDGAARYRIPSDDRNWHLRD